MKIEVEEYDFTCELIEIKQKHVEKFNDRLSALGDNINAIKYAGEICRAAIEAGWIASPTLTIADVDNFDPRLTKRFAGKLGDVYADKTLVKTDIALMAARYAIDPRKNDPPKALIWAWRTKQYGLPNGGGWLEADAGLVQSMTTALSTFDAFSGYQNAQATGRDKDWVESNPEAYQTVIEVTKLMEKK